MIRPLSLREAVAIIEELAYIERAEFLVPFGLRTSFPFRNQLRIGLEIVEQKRHLQQIALYHNQALIIAGKHGVHSRTGIIEQSNTYP